MIKAMYNKLRPEIETLIELGNKRLAKNQKDEGLKPLNLDKIFIGDRDKDDINIYLFLGYLNDDEIMLVQTIMYLGRDGEVDEFKEGEFDEVFKSKMSVLGFEFGKKIDRFVEMNTIASKNPFCLYLQKGLDLIDVIIADEN